MNFKYFFLPCIFVFLGVNCHPENPTADGNNIVEILFPPPFSELSILLGHAPPSTGSNSQSTTPSTSSQAQSTTSSTGRRTRSTTSSTGRRTQSTTPSTGRQTRSTKSDTSSLSPVSGTSTITENGSKIQNFVQILIDQLFKIALNKIKLAEKLFIFSEKKEPKEAWKICIEAAEIFSHLKKEHETNLALSIAYTALGVIYKQDGQKLQMQSRPSSGH